MRFDELERRFERVFVVAVDDGGRGGPVKPAIRPQAFGARRGIGDWLDENDDAHEPGTLPAPWAWRQAGWRDPPSVVLAEQ